MFKIDFTKISKQIYINGYVIANFSLDFGNSLWISVVSGFGISVNSRTARRGLGRSTDSMGTSID